MCSPLFLNKMSCRFPLISIDLFGLLRPLLPYLFLYVNDLSIDVSRVLKLFMIVVLLSVSTFMCINICFVYLGSPIFIYVNKCNILLHFFNHYIMSFFVFCYRLCFKDHFVYMISFLFVYIYMEYLFPSLHFQSVFTFSSGANTKLLPCRQLIDWSYFLSNNHFMSFD